MAFIQTEKTKSPVELPGFLQRDSVIDLDTCSALLGFSKVHVRRLIKAGRVPAPIVVGYRKFGWRAGTLQDFLAAKTAQREAA